VDVVGTDGVTFARGMVFVEAGQLRKVAGRHTSDLPPGMVHEVIHRDDLVLLPDT
jgi:glutamate 5-kinase